jgi:hypothetical protein
MKYPVPLTEEQYSCLEACPSDYVFLESTSSCVPKIDCTQFTPQKDYAANELTCYSPLCAHETKKINDKGIIFVYLYFFYYY